jgi:hypothetical protein
MRGNRRLLNTYLDDRLLQQVKVESAKQRKTMQDWLTEAIVLKLKSDGVEVEQDPNNSRTSPKD